MHAIPNIALRLRGLLCSNRTEVAVEMRNAERTDLTEVRASSNALASIEMTIAASSPPVARSAANALIQDHSRDPRAKPRASLLQTHRSML
jgi:hypothetical protein